jgi:predicted ATPase
MLIRETHCAKEFDDDKNETLAKKVISVAAQEKVVTSRDERIAFIHDSFAEAAYSLLEPGQHTSFHLKLGVLLIKHIPKDLFQKYLFTIADQLARGMGLIEEKDRIPTIHVFQNAGDKSNSACAFPVALSWYSFGISLLREEDWLHHRRLCADVYLKAADSSSITGNYENMNSWLAIIFDQCKGSKVDLLTAYYIQVRKLAAKDEDPRALDVGLEALRLVNIRFPDKNMMPHIMVSNKVPYLTPTFTIATVMQLH